VHILVFSLSMQSSSELNGAFTCSCYIANYEFIMSGWPILTIMDHPRWIFCFISCCRCTVVFICIMSEMLVRTYFLRPGWEQKVKLCS